MLEGGAAENPQAIAAHDDGTVYFVDGRGDVRKLAPGSHEASTLGGAATHLAVYFPAAIAVSQNCFD